MVSVCTVDFKCGFTTRLTGISSELYRFSSFRECVTARGLPRLGSEIDDSVQGSCLRLGCCW